mmetsp:Transcript_29736/g.45558  ORF Transcript_29736/g.45558 Transcript_29736/m.45558 type:complete len:143 (+) Transcript_29736:145-573(+)|eukprot:CAMPEP_0118694896 /NCGR_PEP_ID=MMETSP0800-20121206/12829_1 /TAXON_ID=210618 ORGANISM="Striatella unipunctata, Strain CCMP2910" /NCGR_SAMPLE_ID=MMETSP0800 /ASSEMBLY_ACC=CAM_ASM_000638 /LENGTH=142 /DNA_ID=CAMNT_0006593515 /DNA_START=158 /DNA_END=586 /DNA_ORIENTATION=-
MWLRVRNAVMGAPKLEGEATLPDYFPIEPKGCEYVSQKLFLCISSEAVGIVRDKEHVQVHTNYYTKSPVSETPILTKSDDLSQDEKQALPTAGDNPLDACRNQIALYKQCCDRELKKKKNWLLTEPHRVQEEYRYKGPTTTP